MGQMDDAGAKPQPEQDRRPGAALPDTEAPVAPEDAAAIARRKAIAPELSPLDSPLAGIQAPPPGYTKEEWEAPIALTTGASERGPLTEVEKRGGNDYTFSDVPTSHKVHR